MKHFIWFILLILFWLENRSNLDTINLYLETMKTEINLSKSYEDSTKIILTSFSKFHNKKPFSRINRKDVIAYLDSFRKSEQVDPLHKWIGTYNRYLTVLTRFFKWLYDPTLELTEGCIIGIEAVSFRRWFFSTSNIWSWIAYSRTNSSFGWSFIGSIMQVFNTSHNIWMPRTVST